MERYVRKKMSSQFEQAKLKPQFDKLDDKKIIDENLVFSDKINYSNLRI